MYEIHIKTLIKSRTSHIENLTFAETGIPNTELMIISLITSSPKLIDLY